MKYNLRWTNNKVRNYDYERYEIRSVYSQVLQLEYTMYIIITGYFHVTEDHNNTILYYLVVVGTNTCNKDEQYMNSLYEFRWMNYNELLSDGMNYWIPMNYIKTSNHILTSPLLFIFLYTSVPPRTNCILIFSILHYFN